MQFPEEFTNACHPAYKSIANIQNKKIQEVIANLLLYDIIEW